MPSVRELLSEMPPERREIVEALRDTIKKNLDPDITEGVHSGMIGYAIPHSVYPPGYHCAPSQPLPFVSIANQKGHVGVYLFCVYCDPAEKKRFVETWEKTGLRLDMGASCVRLKKLEQIPLDVIGKSIKRMTAAKFIKVYESSLAGGASPKEKTAKKAKASKKAAKKAVANKTSAKASATRATKKKAKKKASRSG
ncbi:MAG: DUF1801 domain-containing protein [Planctomycetota bacterium]